MAQQRSFKRVSANRAIGSCRFNDQMWLELSKDEEYLSVTDCQLLKDATTGSVRCLGSLWKQWRSFAK